MRERGTTTKTAVVKIMNPAGLAEMAYHQAGHAVAALTWGELKKRDYVTVSPDRRCSLGCFRNPPPSRQSDLWYRLLCGSRTRIENLGVICLAGNAAERRYLRAKRKRLPSGEADRRQLIEVLRTVARVYGERKIYRKLLEVRAELLIGRCWGRVEAVAERLLTDKRLTREQIFEACSGWEPTIAADDDWDIIVDDEIRWIEGSDDFDLEDNLPVN